jgi:hypothetical protein
MKNAPRILKHARTAAAQFLSNHRNWNADDYAYLADKGYTAREILAIWNRSSQTAPQGRAVIFDAVSYLTP